MATLHRPHALPQETASSLRRMLQVITYFGEVCVAPFLAIFMFANSSRPLGDAAALTATGVIAWPLAEYVGHRFVLHRLALTAHRHHYANPSYGVTTSLWDHVFGTMLK